LSDWIIFGLLVIGGIIAFRAFLKVNGANTSKQKILTAKTAQKFLGFEDIQNNMVKIDNYHYRALIQVEPRNFFLESEGEQASIEDAFRRVIDCFHYDTQFFIGSKKMDLDHNLRNIATNIEKLNNKNLSLYGNDLIRFTQAWVENRNLLTRVYYIVIGYDYDPGLSKKPLKTDQIQQQAFQELGNRTMVLSDALNSAGFVPKVLDSVAGAQVYFSFYNRNRALKYKLDNIEKKGLLSPFTTGDYSNGGLDINVEPIK
jgi:hypothetical protein